ncbi:MAG: amidohydrolase family protein [Dehalococcoidales bacterium]|nr:amidohydrolase family protein [Dehalococcoidales bacterium]
MIFDSHVHLVSEDRAKYPMVPGQERPAGFHGKAEWLIELMNDAGVDAALAVQTPWYGEDNRYLVESMRRFPGRFAAIGYLEDPFAPDAPDRLERQYHEDGFRGVRFHLVDTDRGSAVIASVNEGLLAGKADPLIRKARALGVPIQFLNRIPTHPTVLAVADRFPNVTVVVDHLGHPYVAESPDFPSSANFFALAERPNVYVKVSNHVMHSRAAYPWRDLHDYQRRAIDLFGPRRLMWGSNWPMDMPSPTYKERLEAVRNEMPFLSAEEKEWILGKTALSIWTPVGSQS